jgi:alkyl sulfatase BDS1-like metallo-beta-lactamase superfamily hydrolase
MRPILGRDSVREALTVYRDGIRIVLDQTLTGIRQGKAPDELVQEVNLPPDLAASPYLQEYYGSVAWTVRGMYAEHVGWFDGNATNTLPLPPANQAVKMLALVEGERTMLVRAHVAFEADDFQWAAELSDYVLAVRAGNIDAKRLKAASVMQLGERQINATARNYYLTSAQFLLNS